MIPPKTDRVAGIRFFRRACPLVVSPVSSGTFVLLLVVFNGLGLVIVFLLLTPLHSLVYSFVPIFFAPWVFSCSPLDPPCDVRFQSPYFGSSACNYATLGIFLAPNPNSRLSVNVCFFSTVPPPDFVLTPHPGDDAASHSPHSATSVSRFACSPPLAVSCFLTAISPFSRSALKHLTHVGTALWHDDPFPKSLSFYSPHRSPPG